jgi:hypothetical protein
MPPPGEQREQFVWRRRLPGYSFSRSLARPFQKTNERNTVDRHYSLF